MADSGAAHRRTWGRFLDWAILKCMVELKLGLRVKREGISKKGMVGPLSPVLASQIPCSLYSQADETPLHGKSSSFDPNRLWSPEEGLLRESGSLGSAHVNDE